MRTKLAEEYRELSNKELATVIKLNEADKERISKLIKTYRWAEYQRLGFDPVADTVRKARQEAQSRGNMHGRKAAEFNLVNKGSNTRHVLDLPLGLEIILRKEYPMLFSSKENIIWLWKNIPELRISDRI